MTTFNSNQVGILENDLKKYFSDEDLHGVNHLELWDISLLPSGHGHYQIKTKWIINNQEEEITSITSNMQLVDSWKDGEFDLDSGYYDNWEEVVDAMLDIVNPYC